MARRDALRYVGLPSGIADGDGPRLQVSTPSGQIREIPLDRGQLVRIIKSAASALQQLDREERAREQG